MRYTPYSHEALKKAVASSMSAAHMDLTKLMKETLNDEERHSDEALQASRRLKADRLTLVAALGMGIRYGGIFSREEIAALQRVAVKGNTPAMNALRAMQAKRPIDRTKYLGVILWQIKYGGRTGPEVFLAAAHLLAAELQRLSKDKRRLGPEHIGVMQCALTEWLHDRCGPCTGTGATGRSRKEAGRNHPALYVCSSCGGSGAYEPGNQQRAHALKMDIVAFEKKWEKRYDRILAFLQRVDRKTGSSVDRQIRHAYADATDRSHEQQK